MTRIFRPLLAVSALLLAVLTLSACAAPAAPEAAASPTAFTTVSPTAAPTATPSPSPTAEPTPAVTATATAASTPTPTPAGPSMYSSYADLISFDPETGIAKFDYFDLLQGKKAIDFLVSHEGYTQADAEAAVENFADSEFVKKNTNPQLRAIDLDGISLKLMVQPNGEFVEGAESVPSTASDFRAIYALNPDLLLDSYFYYVTVESDGHVSLVEQVYWP